MVNLKALSNEAKEKGLTFPLTYHTDQGDRELEVFLLRHKDPGEPDTITVHEASTGRWLGWGDTKEDARQAASILLHQHFDFGIPLPKVPEG